MMRCVESPIQFKIVEGICILRHASSYLVGEELLLRIRESELIQFFIPS